MAVQLLTQSPPDPTRVQYRLVHFLTAGPSIFSQITVDFSDVDTEVWEFDAIEDRNKVIEPKLEKYSYYYGMALVDREFCKKRCLIFC